jgi:acetyl esterase
MARLEPGIQQWVSRVQQALETLPKPGTPDEYREVRERMAAAFPVPCPETFSITDRFLCAPGRMIPIRIYRPRSQERGPGILFFHGGGFVTGSLDTHDVYALGIAESTGAQVISVHYRLAPENPYPAAVEDCYFTLCWMAQHADREGIDPARVAIGGDSAGGALAAACTLLARDQNGPSISYQYLIFPGLGTDFDSGSFIVNTEDPFLSREDSIYYWRCYLGDNLDTTDPYAVPLRARDLSRLPPAYVLTAEHDPVRDDGERYGKRLADAGVPTVVRRVPGTIHGFLRARLVSAVAADEVRRLGAAIRQALDRA